MQADKVMLLWGQDLSFLKQNCVVFICQECSANANISGWPKLQYHLCSLMCVTSLCFMVPTYTSPHEQSTLLTPPEARGSLGSLAILKYYWLCCISLNTVSYSACDALNIQEKLHTQHFWIFFLCSL